MWRRGLPDLSPDLSPAKAGLSLTVPHPPGGGLAPPGQGECRLTIHHHSVQSPLCDEKQVLFFYNYFTIMSINTFHFNNTNILTESW